MLAERWESATHCILRRHIQNTVIIPEASRAFTAEELQGACVFLIQDPIHFDASRTEYHVFHPKKKTYMFSIAHNFNAKTVYSALEHLELDAAHALSERHDEAAPEPSLPFARPAVYQVYVPRYDLGE